MLTLLLVVSLQAPAAGDWPAYGRDPGGARFSPLTQITRDNVARLQVAWTYHTGMPDLTSMGHRPPALEVTPIVVDGTMYVSTPTGIVAALDPATGAERWRFDAGVDPHRGYGDFVSRGVSFWRDLRGDSGDRLRAPHLRGDDRRASVCARCRIGKTVRGVWLERGRRSPRRFARAAVRVPGLRGNLAARDYRRPRHRRIRRGRQRQSRTGERRSSRF